MKPTWIGAERCGTCKFSFKAERTLICRRNPPAATAVMSMSDEGPVPIGCVANHPPVQDTGWCGEFVRSVLPSPGATVTVPRESRQ